VNKDKASTHVKAEPDRSPAGLRATAARTDGRKAGGFFVPRSTAGVYAEAMRALAREREAAGVKRLGVAATQPRGQ
jgi:predicted phage gp36 major capsid-like protein